MSTKKRKAYTTDHTLFELTKLISLQLLTNWTSFKNFLLINLFSFTPLPLLLSLLLFINFPILFVPYYKSFYLHLNPKCNICTYYFIMILPFICIIKQFLK